MSRTLLSPLDAAWILTESRATPNHVGGLLIFQMPEDAPRDFMRRMMRDFRSYQGFTAPWNRRLQRRLAMLPEWIEDAVTLDLEYHVRHAALPWPGGERELGELVGRLQSTPMDLARPPWECTFIEGLERHRFALFVKMHHSLIDGISGMKLLQRAMASDQGSLGCISSTTARPVRSDTPQSPLRKPITNCPYCAGSERSSPQAWRRACRFSSVAACWRSRPPSSTATCWCRKR